MDKVNETEKKGLSSLKLLLLAIGCWIIWKLLGGTTGAMFGVAGEVFVVWAIIRFIQERIQKSKKNNRKE